MLTNGLLIARWHVWGIAQTLAGQYIISLLCTWLQRELGRHGTFSSPYPTPHPPHSPLFHLMLPSVFLPACCDGLQTSKTNKSPSRWMLMEVELIAEVYCFWISMSCQSFLFFFAVEVLRVRSKDPLSMLWCEDTSPVLCQTKLFCVLHFVDCITRSFEMTQCAVLCTPFVIIWKTMMTFCVIFFFGPLYWQRSDVI